MKKKKNFLPLDIKIEILSRLPVKSLLRFKCVQKSWRGIFENPTFIAAHLNHSSKGNDTFLLYASGQYFRQYYRRGKKITNEILLCPVKLLFGDSVGGCIISSCNGLVCLSTRKSTSNEHRDQVRIHIWNPSTRKILQVPRCDRVESGANKINYVVGFGFFPKLNDYKVVRIVGSLSSKDTWLIEVQVYSLRTKSWKKITTGYRSSGFQLIPCFRPHKFIDGVSYWIGEQLKPRWRKLIMAFKYDEEFIVEINLPNHPDFNKGNVLYQLLTEYRNLLSLIRYRSVDHANVFDLWLKKDSGVGVAAGSWVKQLTIVAPILNRELIPMNFEENGEILLFLEHWTKAVWYNSKSNQIEEVKKLPFPFDLFVSCRESLVSLPGEVSVESLRMTGIL